MMDKRYDRMLNHHKYMMDGALAMPMILYLVSRGSRLYFGPSAGGRRTEFFNTQCILWEQRECYAQIE